ncbi:MAG: four helix bundle protein [Planctomycetales bacterium]|nr:four helix bundle protein [Planctomycetales bacterium]
MNKEELKQRTKRFAHRCVKLCMALPNTILGRHISGQLVRSSTAVAANYRAVCMAQSRATFISKLAIVIEEVDESYFWIEFASDEKLVKPKQIAGLLEEAQALTAIFVASQNTARRNKK